MRYFYTEMYFTHFWGFDVYQASFPCTYPSMAPGGGYVISHYFMLYMQVFPGDLLSSTCYSDDGAGMLIARSEVERRSAYFEHLEEGEISELIKSCLHNDPSRRPAAEQLVRVLVYMKANVEGPDGALAKMDAVRQVMIVREERLREAVNDDSINEDQQVACGELYADFCLHPIGQPSQLVY